jgi:hypothetical protein
MPSKELGAAPIQYGEGQWANDPASLAVMTGHDCGGYTVWVIVPLVIVQGSTTESVVQAWQSCVC